MVKILTLLSFVLPFAASIPVGEIKVGSRLNEDTSRTEPTTRSPYMRHNYYSGGNGVYPGNVVYTIGGYYPGVGGYYPGNVGGGYPGVYPGFGGMYPAQNPGAGSYPSIPGAGSYPSIPGEQDFGGEGGRIPNAVPVDDEVEVFEVPGSNRGRYPGL